MRYPPQVLGSGDWQW